MVQIIADNIISGLGKTTLENLRSIRQGQTALKENLQLRVPDGGRVVVATTDDSLIDTSIAELNATRLEKFMISSVKEACSNLGGVLSLPSTIFIFSTTKGNIDYIESNCKIAALWHSAKVVSDYFGNPNTPITVSNACISGAVAIIVAKRLLDAGLYDTAIVVGADEVTEFVVSGFGSFKALSDEPCRPFDANRKGLNLGEAVGTIVLQSVRSAGEIKQNSCFVVPQFVTAGAISNDANHISGPSRTAEGLYRAIMRTLSLPYGSKTEGLAEGGFINPHGTATMYNDQMESLAIFRSGLDSLPVSPLKSYYGHTLGASAVIETILSAHFMDEGWLPAAIGYQTAGCTPPPKISSSVRKIEARWFLKTVSGFGGCNAALKVERMSPSLRWANPKPTNNVEAEVLESFCIDYKGDIKDYLSHIYSSAKITYPKFHKMDLLCKAGIVAGEHILKTVLEDDTTALVFMNASSSYCADSEYNQTIKADNFYPSPAIFVYTLPSIVIGEISIRHKLYGEGIFFIEESFNRNLAMEYIRCLFCEGAAKRALLCWIEVRNNKCSLSAELVCGF